MRIYISGQITGLDLDVAKAYFKQTEEQITKAGHIPVNPMEIHPTLDGPTWHDFMAEDIKALLYCDAILMLENWTNSRGAKIEHGIAQGLGIPVYYSKNHNFF